MWPIGHKYSQIKVMKQRHLNVVLSTCFRASLGLEVKGKLQGAPQILDILSSWGRSF